jgi:glycosyltransferase involved in cell wall biosynthesis
MKTILVISYSNLAADSRVNRQLRWLSESHRVVAAGLTDPGLPEVRFVSLKHTPPRKSAFARAKSALQILAHRYESHYWRLPPTVAGLRALEGIPADLVLANDIEALPLAVRLFGDRPVIFDSHEYAPRQFDNSLVWKVFLQGYRMYLCKAYIPRTAAMLTVCQGIADQYQADTGVKPIVLTNAAEYHDLQPQLKPESTDKIRMIHHGAASPPREIERMIRAMSYLDDRFQLDLLLVPGSKEYIARLEAMARPDKRIRCLPPVPMNELVSVSSAYDIGLFLVPPTTFNLRHTLPNKLFEFIQARLAVAIGPSTEMANIVRQYDCGVVASGFSPRELAAALSGLDHTRINHFKRQSHEAAGKLSAERNKELLLNLVANLLEEPHWSTAPGGDRNE